MKVQPVAKPPPPRRPTQPPNPVSSGGHPNQHQHQPVYFPSALGAVHPPTDRPPPMYVDSSNGHVRLPYIHPPNNHHPPSNHHPPPSSYAPNSQLPVATRRPSLENKTVNGTISVGAERPTSGLINQNLVLTQPSTPGFLRNSVNASIKFTPPQQNEQDNKKIHSSQPLPSSSSVSVRNTPPHHNIDSESRKLQSTQPPSKPPPNNQPVVVKGTMRSSSKALFTKNLYNKADDEEEGDNEDDEDYNLEPHEVYDWIAMDTSADLQSITTSPVKQVTKINIKEAIYNSTGGSSEDDNIYATFTDRTSIPPDSSRPNNVPALQLELQINSPPYNPNVTNGRNSKGVTPSKTGVRTVPLAAAGLRIGTGPLPGPDSGGSKSSDNSLGPLTAGSSSALPTPSPMMSKPNGGIGVNVVAPPRISVVATPHANPGGNQFTPNAAAAAGMGGFGGGGPSSGGPVRNAGASGRVKPAPPPKSPYAVKETTDVKRNRAQLPANMTHAKPTTGDWLKKRYIVNNYILLDVLGEGSYGEVRLCKDRTTDALYGIKIISKEMLNKKKNGKTSETYFEDIKREIAIMKKLLHPNVLRLYEVLDDPKINKLYLVLEYMKKGDLVKVLKDREQEEHAAAGTVKMIPTGYTPLSDSEYWNIFRQVTAGVRYLHLQNIVHGDIKPQNLLIGEDGVVKIADFGISKMMSSSTQNVVDAAGTPAFMSPELFDFHDGDSVSGPLADVWALGATMFMLRFGQPPFVASNIGLLGTKIRNDPLVFPQPIDNSLRDLIENMLIKDPKERFSLQQVLAHPYLRQQPNPNAVGPTALMPATKSRPSTTGIPESPMRPNGTSSKLNDVKFLPPESYHKEEEEATKLPVSQLSHADMFASIGLGVKKRQVQKKIDEVGSPEQVTFEEADDEEEGVEGDGAKKKEEDDIDVDIMATKWGEDVFEQVDDLDMSDSDDDDKDSVDGDGSVKNLKKATSKKALVNGSVNSSNNAAGHSQPVQNLVPRNEMSKGEEEARMKRFQVQRTKKSLENLVPKPQDGLSISTASPSRSSDVPSAVTAHYGSNQSMRFSSKSPSEKNPIEEAFLSPNRSGCSNKSQASTPVMMRGKKHSISTCESIDGLDEDEEMNALSMEDFDKMMDTLAQQPKVNDSSGKNSPISPVDVKGFKSSFVNKLNGVGAAFHSERGVRPTQEDRCVLLHDVSKMRALEEYDFDSKESNETIMNQLKHFSFAGVFDGHSGWKCSQFLSENLAAQLVINPKFFDKTLDSAILEAFALVDRQVCAMLSEEDDSAGSTAILAIYDGRRKVFTVASVGDSMCVLSRGGKAVEIGKTHRLTNETEIRRIQAAGGSVINSRVNGVLAVSRAFGDVQFKDMKSLSTGLVIAVPEISSEMITPMTEFAIIASDGLWDVISPQAAVKFVRNFLVTQKSASLQTISTALSKEALIKGSVDNVTVLIISFHCDN